MLSLVVCEPIGVDGLVPRAGYGGKLQVAYGSGIEQNVYVQLTVVDGVGQKSRLFHEKSFGPKLSVTTDSHWTEPLPSPTTRRMVWRPRSA